MTWLHVLGVTLLLTGSAVSLNRIIIDTDAGSDDGLAISLAIGLEESEKTFQILGITAAYGNTNVHNVARNVLKVLDTTRRLDIPVYKGSNFSLVRTLDSDNFFGIDGFGDVDYPNPPSENLIKDTHAVQFLVETVKANPGNISIICLGPLTNIAQAIRLDENFLRNVRELIFLGGTTKGEGNVKPGVEFNIYMDPEAAFVIFSEAERISKTIRMIPLEAATAASISWEWRKNVLGAIGSPIINLLTKAEEYNYSNSSLWTYPDSIAVASALVQDFPQETINLYGQVETCGDISRGATIMVRENQGESKSKSEPFPQIRAIKEGSLNVTFIQNMFLKYLNI